MMHSNFEICCFGCEKVQDQIKILDELDFFVSQARKADEKFSSDDNHDCILSFL
jgi:hypothetical protein